MPKRTGWFLLVLMFVAPLSTHAEDACVVQPDVHCVLNLARHELDDFARAEEPPRSSMWTEDIAEYGEPAKEEATRIVLDVYGKVAAGYVAIGDIPQAQETLDSIGNPSEAVARIIDLQPKKTTEFEPQWLRNAVMAAANAKFPFETDEEYFLPDSLEWHDYLRFAMDAGIPEIVVEQAARGTAFAAGPDFEALSSEEQDDVRLSLMQVALLREDVATAEQWCSAVNDPDQRWYCNSFVAEELAKLGQTEKALKLTETIGGPRLEAIYAVLGTHAALQSDLKGAEGWMKKIEMNGRQLVVDEVVTAGRYAEADALSLLLGPAGRARVLNKVVLRLIAEGQLERAVLVTAEMDEIGERAVGNAAIALAAARIGKSEVVEQAAKEIERLASQGIDKAQIVDALIFVTFAQLILPDGKPDVHRLPDIQKRIAGITTAAFPDAPVEALRAGEDHARLLIQLAALQFALGRPEEAEKSIAEVAEIGDGATPETIAFSLAEAAGIAFSIGGSSLGKDPVQRSLRSTNALKWPMDRAMVLSHLAEEMIK